MKKIKKIKLKILTKSDKKQQNIATNHKSEKQKQNVKNNEKPVIKDISYNKIVIK